jgi:hypothetical protein
MPSVLSQPYFTDEHAAFDQLEAIVWFMSHRLREATKVLGMEPMGGSETLLRQTRRRPPA